ncbi:hypothetical protein ACFE04_019311 [Oxalis oulophora]
MEEGLSNAFSLLELDAGDSQIIPPIITSTSTSSSSSSSSEAATSKKEEKTNGELKIEKPFETTTYRFPLVWIDLEMTGLIVETDRILEIACIITDGNLTKSLEGPDLVIHQSKECMDSMGEWCQEHHAASGLTKKVLHSTVTEREAEKQVIDFVKKNTGNYTPQLAGNSVYHDYLFLKKYMPDLASLFTHVLVDVSSIKSLCDRWYPRDRKKAPKKENNHRAMDDIRESINELKYYKDNIFKPKSKHYK